MNNTLQNTDMTQLNNFRRFIGSATLVQLYAHYDLHIELYGYGCKRGVQSYLRAEMESAILELL